MNYKEARRSVVGWIEDVVDYDGDVAFRDASELDSEGVETKRPSGFCKRAGPKGISDPWYLGERVGAELEGELDCYLSIGGYVSIGLEQEIVGG